MGMFKKLKKNIKKASRAIGNVAQKAAPYAGLIPGVGTLAGAALGAGGSALSGDSRNTILSSGIKGGVGGYLGGQVGGLPGIIGGMTGAGGGLANIGLGGLNNIANVGLSGGLGAVGGGSLLQGGYGGPAGQGGLLGGGGFGSNALLGSLLNAGAGLYGANQADNAADAQQDAARDALGLQRDIYNQQRADQEPFRQAGLTGQNRMLDLLGLSQNTGAEGYGKYARDFGEQDFQQDPGYQFRLSEGLKALDRQAAARGGLISGAALKAAGRYGQQSASDEYQNAFNRYQVNRSNQLNPLQGLTGQAQSATNTLGQAGQNYAGQAGQSYSDMGNARAAGYIGQSNAIGDGLQNALGYYQNQQMVNRLPRLY